MMIVSMESILSPIPNKSKLMKTIQSKLIDYHVPKIFNDSKTTNVFDFRDANTFIILSKAHILL